MTTDDKLTDEEAIKLAEWLGIEVFHLPFSDNDYVPCVKVLCGQTRPTTTYLDSAEGEVAMIRELRSKYLRILFDTDNYDGSERVDIMNGCSHWVGNGNTETRALQRAILRMIND